MPSIDFNLSSEDVMNLLTKRLHWMRDVRRVHLDFEKRDVFAQVPKPPERKKGGGWEEPENSIRRMAQLADRLKVMRQQDIDDPPQGPLAAILSELELCEVMHARLQAFMDAHEYGGSAFDLLTPVDRNELYKIKYVPD